MINKIAISWIKSKTNLILKQSTLTKALSTWVTASVKIWEWNSNHPWRAILMGQCHFRTTIQAIWWRMPRKSRSNSRLRVWFGQVSRIRMGISRSSMTSSNSSMTKISNFTIRLLRQELTSWRKHRMNVKNSDPKILSWMKKWMICRLKSTNCSLKRTCN